jgi:hypothetical protein
MRFNRFAGVVFLVMIAPAALPAELYFLPKVSGYFDNFTSLDSTVSASNASVQDTVDTFNDELHALLGPSANISVTHSDLSLKSQQANYRLAGGSLQLLWTGTGGDSFKNRLTLSVLAGRADVRTELLTRSLFNFQFGTQTAQDITTTSDDNLSHLQRLDTELSIEMQLTDHAGVVGSARWERVRDRVEGRQKTVSSQNIASLILSLAGQSPLFNLSEVDGTNEGDITYNLYSARLGAVVHTLDSASERHFFYLSAQVHASYSPAAKGHLISTPDDPSLGIGSVVVEGKTVPSWSAGPDIVAGYTYQPLPRFGVYFQYRTTVYFGLSGDTRASDPRVNHGATAGLMLKLY